MGRRPKRAPRTTVNYTLFGMFGEPVYHGITNNPQRRFQQHRESGKYFEDYYVSPKRSRRRAEKEETHAIHQHQNQNMGMAPSYNIAKVKPRTWGFW